MTPASFPDVVILAGGLGKRLHPVTGGTQKVLATIGDQPFLEILIDYIASQGGARFILCVGHGRDEVIAHFQNKYQDREIIFSREASPLGTGGAMKHGSQHVKSEQFLAMNGDCFCVIDYRALIAFHKKNNANATLAITKISDPSDYGSVLLDGKHRVEGFREKRADIRGGFINTGTYCFEQNIFSLVETPPKFSIEHDFFPRLAGKGFYGFEVENNFIDIGTPERYSLAQKYLKTLKGNRI